MDLVLRLGYTDSANEDKFLDVIEKTFHDFNAELGRGQFIYTKGSDKVVFAINEGLLRITSKRPQYVNDLVRRIEDTAYLGIDSSVNLEEGELLEEERKVLDV